MNVGEYLYTSWSKQSKDKRKVLTKSTVLNCTAVSKSEKNTRLSEDVTGRRSKVVALKDKVVNARRTELNLLSLLMISLLYYC